MTKQLKILLAFLIGLYLFTRFFNLLIIPVFADEAIYIRWSQIAWLDPNHRMISLTDGKPPLHIWAMIPFWTTISDPLFAGRLTSIIAGLATMIGIFFTGKKLLNKEVGGLAAFLYIVQPFALMYDRMALADSMLTAFGIWIFYTALHLFRKPTIVKSIILGILFAAAMLTKPTGIIFMILTPLLLFIIPIQKKSKNQYSVLNTQYYSNWFSTIKQLIIPAIISGIIGLGIYNLLRLSNAFYMIELRSLDYTRSQEEIITKFHEYFLQTFVVITKWLSSYLTLPVLIIITIFPVTLIILDTIKNNKQKVKKNDKPDNKTLMKAIKNGKYSLWFKPKKKLVPKWLFNLSQTTWIAIILFLYALIPTVGEATVGKIIFPRYSLFILPAILLLLSLTIITILKTNWGNRLVISGISIIVFAMIFVWLRFSAFLLLNPANAPLEYAERSQYIENWSAGYGIQDAAQFLKTTAQNRNIVVGVEGYWVLESSLSMYLEGTQAFKNIEFVSQNPQIGELDQYLIDQSLQGIPTFLIVNSNRLLSKDERLQEIGRTTRPIGREGEQSLVIYRILEIQEIPRE